MAEVTIRAADGGSFSAYVATPKSGKGPGIVLIQEIFGVNKVMRDLADGFAAQGYTVMCPDLFWRQEPGVQITDKTEAEWKKAFALMQGFNTNKGIDDLKATLAFHVYFGDAAPHIDELLKLPVDAIGVDLVQTDVKALGSGWNKGLVAGVINGRSSILESPKDLVDVARHLADIVRPRNLYLSSNCELGYLPTSVAEQKVQRLGEAARKVKELVSV